MNWQEEVEYIERKFHEHRTGKIVCERTCFCWEVDFWLSRIGREEEEDA